MITIDTNNPITNRARRKWGIPYQLDILQEEAGEVVTAISRFERGRVGTEKVAEEIADFIVSMMSVVPALGIEQDIIDFKNAKLERLRVLMETGKRSDRVSKALPLSSDILDVPECSSSRDGKE